MHGAKEKYWREKYRHYSRLTAGRGGVTPLPGRVGGPVASRTMPWSRGTARIDAGCRRTARTLSTSTRPLYRSEFRPVVRLPFASRPRASFHLLVARLVHYTHRTTRHIARPYDYDRREYEDRPGTPGKLRATLPPSPARPRTMPWPGAARTSRRFNSTRYTGSAPEPERAGVTQGSGSGGPTGRSVGERPTAAHTASSP